MRRDVLAVEHLAAPIVLFGGTCINPHRVLRDNGCNHDCNLVSTEERGASFYVQRVLT